MVAFSPPGGDGTGESGDRTRRGGAGVVGEWRRGWGNSPVVAVVPDIDVKVFHLGRTLFSRGSREINRIKSLPTGFSRLFSRARRSLLTLFQARRNQRRLKRNALWNLFGAYSGLLQLLPLSL